MSDADAVTRAAKLIRARAQPHAPRLAIVLGSGLGGIADAIAAPVALPYAELPGFPRSAVAGHENRLVLGTLGGLPVACLQGRVRVYECAGCAAMAVRIRVGRRAGGEVLAVGA